MRERRGAIFASEIFSVSGKMLKNYPDLSHKLLDHCVIKLDDFVYCIGGTEERYVTNHVHRLNLKNTNSEWEEVASMAEKRSYFGAAVYKGCLVVAGGYDRKSLTSTAELYESQPNRWRNYVACFIEYCKRWACLSCI